MSGELEKITSDELLLMSDAECRHELVEGRLLTAPLRGFVNGLVAGMICSRLGSYVKTNKLGCVFSAGSGFFLEQDPDTVLAPGAAFVRQSRLDEIGLPKAFFPEAPALVVEVASPGDTIEEVDTKIRRWLTAGTELAWVVNPSGRTVTVYRALDDIRVLTEKDTLTGEAVVLGFECLVAELFTGLKQ